MGTDIHAIFETKAPTGEWRLTFPRTPHVEYWYERIADDYNDETAPGKETQNESLTRYVEVTKPIFTAMSPEEIMSRYGDDPRLVWDYNLPNRNKPVNIGGDPNTPWMYTPADFTQRDYEWFEALGLVRYNGDEDQVIFPLKGLPEDLSPEGHKFVEYMGDDGHSHSWIMVRDILNQQIKLGHFSQYVWLTRCIKDPENTRVVFYFDN